ncbi:MAG: hypothetical protein K2H98_07585 [Duncaniella sp.]|nr:hypothetical protein [Duncaniella sp.]
MKQLSVISWLLASIAIVAYAGNPVLHTGSDDVNCILDGNTRILWRVAPEIKPDILETFSENIIFISDCDTLTVRDLKEWEKRDLDFVTAAGDTALVRVVRLANNPLENPDPDLLKISPSGKLSREQAIFDIDALIYTISQVHPDIFSVCRQEDFLRAVKRAKESVPDSLSAPELYMLVAPAVALIGDGHTGVRFPYQRLFNSDPLRMPLFMDVNTDFTLTCTSSLDSIIPRGADIISINGITADSLITSMLPYESGEKTHFRIAGIDYSFTALYHMLYPADSYTVVYRPEGSKKTLTHVLPAVRWDAIKKRCPSTGSGLRHDIYSFDIDSTNNVAVMDFRSFADVERMEHFSDSMFTALREKNIGNLIIDLRNNGGGNSRVGDILLRYISPEPFTQMEKTFIRTTPLTLKLMGAHGGTPELTLYETRPSDYIRPLTTEEGHYDGKVYLLISNNTYSSAGSFAWAFKVCGMGTVIGQETGGMNVHYGDVVGYPLPVSNLYTYIPWKRFWQFRADETDIHGTIPDIEVPARDALTTALKLASENKRKD